MFRAGRSGGNREYEWVQYRELETLSLKKCINYWGISLDNHQTKFCCFQFCFFFVPNACSDLVFSPLLLTHQVKLLICAYRVQLQWHACLGSKVNCTPNQVQDIRSLGLYGRSHIHQDETSPGWWRDWVSWPYSFTKSLSPLGMGCLCAKNMIIPGRCTESHTVCSEDSCKCCLPRILFSWITLCIMQYAIQRIHHPPLEICLLGLNLPPEYSCPFPMEHSGSVKL